MNHRFRNLLASLAALGSMHVGATGLAANYYMYVSSAMSCYIEHDAFVLWENRSGLVNEAGVPWIVFCPLDYLYSLALNGHSEVWTPADVTTIVQYRYRDGSTTDGIYCRICGSDGAYDGANRLFTYDCPDSSYSGDPQSVGTGILNVDDLGTSTDSWIWLECTLPANVDGSRPSSILGYALFGYRS